MSAEPLIAHSLVEVDLYLMVAPCSDCGEGPLVGRTTASQDRGDAGDSTLVARVEAVCNSCQSNHSLVFKISDLASEEAASDVSPINPGDEPSRLIDVGQWITLSRMITESVASESDKVRARTLKIEASACLGEALKFYDDPDNDLPPAEALFSERSRARFREAPHQFSRRRLIDMRASMPSPTGSGH